MTIFCEFQKENRTVTNFTSTHFKVVHFCNVQTETSSQLHVNSRS